MVQIDKEPINPQSMLRDNYSGAAEQNMERILELRESGKLMVVWGCSDARLILPDDVYQIRTIAGTGPRSSFANLLNYPNVRGIIILDHVECGGLKTKAQLPENIQDEDTALGFVKEHVWNDDPVIQSILTGSWTASRTQKSVMSLVQDQFDGSIYPQAIYKNGDQTEHKTIPTYQLMPKQYVPEAIYGTEIPVLRDELIPPPFAQVLATIDQKVQDLRAFFPDILERQAIQDPEVVAVTTNLKPLSARFPTLFGEPNVAFQVSLKRQSLEDEGDIEDRDVINAFRQVHYPISHTIENQHHDGRAPFKSTKILYIETGDMRDSVRLAKQVRRRLWIQEWLELPGRAIVVAEAVKGKIQQIEEVGN